MNYKCLFYKHTPDRVQLKDILKRIEYFPFEVNLNCLGCKKEFLFKRIDL